jgi:glycerol-3-phosphate dehydrogenase
MADADPYDLAVIGAGTQGAGVAQAAAAAGLRVLVLERSEPAAGTSSRSTKLIHGGLRYLETGQIRLVREALREQRLLLANAPGLVHRLRLRIPVYRHGTRRPGTLYAGLLLYRLLGSEMGFRHIDPCRWDNPDGLDTRDLLAVLEFHEAQTDDAALTRAVLRSALDLGAKLECPAEVTGIARLPDGWELAYGRDGQARTCHAAALVNAAGPWVNRVLGLITPAVPGLDLDLVRGAHLVLAGALHGGGYYCESPRDRRAVFVLPWKGDSTLVGTTETPFGGDPDQVHPLPEEIAYLQETVARHFPGRPIEVQSAFAGLRVLPRGPGGPSGRPRDSLIAVESARPPRLVTLCGGKLTTYRATAARVLALLRPALPDTRRSGDTRQIQIAPARIL